MGSHLADALNEAGHYVKVFDLQESPYLKHGQEMVVGNIIDERAVKDVIRGCDFVYNLAGIADLDDARTKSIDTIKQNILGNATILEACVELNVKRILYASTIYVYSEKGGFYRCSKQAAETYIEEYQRRYGLSFTILRYGTLYGPRSDQRNSIHKYLHQALTEGRITVEGSGDEHREYIHVKDAARLSVGILKQSYSNTHITITGHQVICFRDLLNMIREILKNKIKVEFIEEKEDNAHYKLTPYSYTPKVGNKLTSNRYTDLGQGLLECITEIDEKQNRRNPGQV